MRKWIGCTLAIWLLLSPTLASAYCSETNGRLITRFEDAVNASIDYLLCLHNEQVVTLNSHATTLNAVEADLATLFASQSSSKSAAEAILLREVITRYTALSEENARLSIRLGELEGRLSSLEQFAP